MTPYDILRLKNRLGLSSSQFLKRYTVSHVGPESGLPVVSLKMLAKEDFKCPFVGPKGCAVYKDRPGACRTYPLGRMAVRNQGQHDCKETFFLIKENHCLGFQESKEWTIETWKKNQRLETYNAMNDLMMDVLSLKNRSGKRRLTKEEAEIFSMACYDLDRFRDFVFQEDLLKTASSKTVTKKTIQTDDVALMQYALEWVKEVLFANPNKPFSGSDYSQKREGPDGIGR
jgi:Fe-S-cluster containining protein